LNCNCIFPYLQKFQSFSSHAVEGSNSGDCLGSSLSIFLHSSLQEKIFDCFLYFGTFFTEYFLPDIFNHEGHVSFEYGDSLKHGLGLPSENRIDVHLFYFVGALDPHFSLLFGHCFKSVEGGLLD